MLYLTPDTWNRYLPCYIWPMIPDTVLAMLYLTHDIRHRYLPCYIWHMTPDTGTCMLYLTHDIWHQYSTCYTWHLIPDTWYMTPKINMLSLGTSTLDMILWHLIGDYYTWDLYYLAYSWILLLQRLGMIIILLPDIWYSWTPVLLNSCILEPLKRVTPDTILLLIPVIR